MRLPFGLKVVSDLFQERLDRVIRLLPGVIGIEDDILTHGSTITEHDGRVIALLETARLNSLTLNSKKMQFRSQDCKFFGHRLTPEGLKVDSDKSLSNHTDEVSRDHTRLEMFPRYGKLFKQI